MMNAMPIAIRKNEKNCPRVIPAMFGYNFLVTSIRAMIVEMDNFAAELASEFEHKLVDHGARDSAFRR